MKALLLIFPVAFILAGCAVVDTGGGEWYKEGATVRDRDAALSAARAQAEQATSGKPDPGDVTKKQMIVSAMTGQGWRLLGKGEKPPMKPEASRKLPPPGANP